MKWDLTGYEAKMGSSVSVSIDQRLRGLQTILIQIWTHRNYFGEDAHLLPFFPSCVGDDDMTPLSVHVPSACLSIRLVG